MLGLMDPPECHAVGLIVQASTLPVSNSRGNMFDFMRRWIWQLTKVGMGYSMVCSASNILLKHIYGAWDVQVL